MSLNLDAGNAVEVLRPATDDIWEDGRTSFTITTYRLVELEIRLGLSGDERKFCLMRGAEALNVYKTNAADMFCCCKSEIRHMTCKGSSFNNLPVMPPVLVTNTGGSGLKVDRR